MATRENLLTAEQFWKIAISPENEERRFELEDGVIVEMAPSSAVNSVTAMRIGYFLNAFVIPRNLGYVTGADGGYQLGLRRVRQPDVGYISRERAGELSREFTLAPDLAVEIVSPDEDVFKKAREYLQAGTSLVWAVYTEEKTVYVMRLDEDGGIYSRPYDLDSTLDGGNVLPDFSLTVRDIFPE